MPSPAQPLGDLLRQTAIEHILTATRRLAVREGLDVTMDQIAEAAGTSRRTLFRLFTSHGQLLAVAFAAGDENFGRQLPPFDGDLERWLRSTCEAAHNLNSAYGLGHWEMISRQDLSPELAAAATKRRHLRDRAMARMAATLWQAAGQDGDAPDNLESSISSHLSAHFTAAVIADAGLGWEDAADLAYHAILAALRRDTEAATAQSPDPAPAFPGVSGP